MIVMPLSYVATMALLLLALWNRRRAPAGRPSIGHYGAGKSTLDPQLPAGELTRMVLYQYLGHQRACFALAWLGAAAGLFFGVWVMGNLSRIARRSVEASDAGAGEATAASWHSRSCTPHI